MKNEEILKKIDENKQDADDKKEKFIEKQIKFIVFFIANKRYAINADIVREILLTDDIYFLPFVPRYVVGLINRHGEPYAVLSLRVLFENDEIESKKFLILNLEGDRVAFMITDVIEILEINESKIHFLSLAKEESSYFTGSINMEKEEVLILDVKNILGKLENDLR